MLHFYRKTTKIVCRHPLDQNFTPMGSPNKIWAISAIHSDAEKLTSLHNHILNKIKPGDRIVYMGNYTGYGTDATQVVDELLTFRRLVLSLPGMMPKDFVYLRGAQDEMWQKLLQLQFAPDAQNVFLWMLGNGLSNTLYSYGLSPHEGIDACKRGVMGITKWTCEVRKAIRKHAGHEIFNMQLTRAAHTAKDANYPMLFVHSGLDNTKTLEAQDDCLWWASAEFENINVAYKPFEKVVRGFDPAHGGVHLNCVTATIDGGCGFGGALVCAGFGADGTVDELIEV